MKRTIILIGICMLISIGFAQSDTIYIYEADATVLTFSIQETDTIIPLTGIEDTICFVQNNGLKICFATADIDSITFRPPIPSVVIADSATGITNYSATLWGTFIEGSKKVISKGFEYKLSTEEEWKTAEITGSDVKRTVNVLDAESLYEYRGYIITVSDTVYSEIETFTTLVFVCGNKIMDIDENLYTTLLLGSQCWMKINLKTTRYNDGTPIANYQPVSDKTNTTAPTFFGSEEDTISTYGAYPLIYGYLYNWAAVMNQTLTTTNYNDTLFKNICPKGWKVPSSQDWTDLTDYVGSQEEYRCNDNPNNTARALASTTNWIYDHEAFGDCYPGSNGTANNATGFTAIPAGRFAGGSGTTHTEGYHANFWTSTQVNNTTASSRVLYNANYPYVDTPNYTKGHGFSVRCVKDE